MTSLAAHAYTAANTQSCFRAAMRHWPYFAIFVSAIGLLWMSIADASGQGATWRISLAVVLLGAIAFSAMRLWAQARQSMLTLEELRGWVNLLAGTPLSEANVGKIGELPVAKNVQSAILDMLGRQLELQGVLLRRFEAMLNTLPDGVAVITTEGLISLVNSAGRKLFAALSPVVGKSAFEVLSRGSLQRAIEQAGESGAPFAASLFTIHGVKIDACVVSLGPEGGALLRYPATAAERVGAMEHDLTLHDRPPAPGTVEADHPIATLPMLSLDTETTGLDPTTDRVVSIGAVRMLGARLFRRSVLNLLVNPGRTIPAHIVAVHGISNAMASNAPGFRGIASDVVTATDGLVLVGHHIDFDRAILAAEMRRIGREWAPKATLDVMLLYAGLFPDSRDLSLDSIAQALGVRVVGRHSALGDALTVAEVFSQLAPILESQGITTLGRAQTFCQAAMARIIQQSPDAKGRRQ
jgi:DNA polymerase-3 subunit epsilon